MTRLVSLYGKLVTIATGSTLPLQSFSAHNHVGRTHAPKWPALADFDTWQNRVMQRTWKITHGGSGHQMGRRRLLVYRSGRRRIGACILEVANRSAG
jgi:hypothetical protein